MKKLIVLNWKMNGSLPLVKDYGVLLSSLSLSHQVVVCPPALYVWSMIGAGVDVGLQDCHTAVSGSYTGCISAKMGYELGAKYVLVGHSERRTHFFETDVVVSQKAKTAHENGLHPIICVGESLEAYEEQETLSVLKDQLAFSVPKDLAQSEALIIAYEPVWAIGTGKVATEKDIRIVHTFIKECYPKAKVLYGGSVTAAHCSILLNAPYVDGVLIGGASLKIDELKKILIS